MGKPTIWQRIRCRWRAYHTWVDADGDGLTDTCAVCGRGVWQPDKKHFVVE